MTETLSNFEVMRLVRDSHTARKADRQLLDALALRCNPAQRYSCWPSYRLLATDTDLDEVTLKRAAKRLEDAGLIHRSVRANRSNRFYINVGKLQQQALAFREAAEAAKRDAFDEEDLPFEQPVGPADQYMDDEDGGVA